MNCKDVQELLPLHVGGDLAAKKTQAVTVHLENCGACADSAGEYRESYRLTKEFEPPTFSAEFYDGIRQSVLSEIARDSNKSRSWFLADFLPRSFRLRPEWAIAAMLLVAVFAFYFVSNRDKGPSETVRTPSSGYPGEVVPTRSPEVAGTVTPGPPNNERKRIVRNGLAIRKPRPYKGVRPVNEPTYSAQPMNTPEEAVAVSPAAPTISEKPLRMELQTSDSNIRIIWFTYQNAKQDSPGKGF